MYFKLNLFLSLLLVSTVVLATTRNVTCSGDITTAMNSAISASTSGDIVNISSGTCSMSRLSSISDRNITIQGAGKSSTIITANNGFGQIITNGSNSPTWTLKGFRLSGNTTNTQAIVVWADAHASWRGPFLIEDIDFDFPNNTGQIIALFGPIYGVIADSIFTNSIESAILTSLALTSSIEDGTIDALKGAFAASFAYSPGNANYLYIEDNVFNGASTDGMAAIDTGYTGARIVFRHNTLNRTTLYSHWTAGDNWNSLWWEVYNNTFNFDGPAGYQAARLQGGGTGLWYNNTVIGFTNNNITIGEDRLARGGGPLFECDGTHSWDGTTDSSAPGWPCLSQTGRDAGKTMSQIQGGSKQASFPLYVWNNGPQAKCSNPAASGSACDNSFGVDVNDPLYFKTTTHSTSGFGNGDKDFCIATSQPATCGTHTLTYTPYTYPHPLRTAGGVAPTISSIVCSPTSIQAPSGTSNCTTTASESPTSYSYSFSSCTAAGCSTTDTDSIATVGCSNGGPCTVCATATNEIGTSSQFCTAAGHLKSKYRKPSNVQAN